jgi:DNA-binding transcriptional LysR family regulator
MPTARRITLRRSAQCSWTIPATNEQALLESIGLELAPLSDPAASTNNPRRPTRTVMDFAHLLAFYEVARAGSVSAGADVLHVSQPAITREIKELEQGLGLVLFDYAGRIFALSDAAETELKELAGLSAGHLKIGASATVGVYLVPDMIAGFNTGFPQVTAELTVANTREVEDGLGSQGFALGFIEGPYDPTSLEARAIGTNEIVAVAAAAHAALTGKLMARDLAMRAVLLREPGSGTRAVVEDAYVRAGLKMEPMMSINSTEAIKRMLLARQCVTYVSSLSVRDEVRRGDLGTVQVKDLRIERALYMVWLKGRTFAPSTQAFFDLVLKAAVE